MEKIKDLLVSILGMLLLVVLPNMDIVGKKIAEKLGLFYFNFECTNFITCYLAEFSETLNGIVYFWLPLFVIFGVYTLLARIFRK